MGASMGKNVGPRGGGSKPQGSARCCGCKLTPDELKRTALTEAPSTLFFQSEVDRLQVVRSSTASDAEKMNAELNTVFLKRMLEIEEKTDGDVDLKLINYKEWVQMLQGISDATVRNMELLQKEVTAVLRKCEEKVESHEAAKYRRDISKLLKIIKNGSQNLDWQVDDMDFETLTKAEISSLKNMSAGKPKGSGDWKQEPRSKIGRRHIS